MTFNRVYIRHS